MIELIKLVVAIIILLSIFVGCIIYYFREKLKKRFNQENIKKWIEEDIERKESIVHTFIMVFIVLTILTYIIYYLDKIDIINFSIIILGLILIEYMTYYFWINRTEYFSLSFFVIVATWLLLNIITFYPDLLLGMKIPDMDLSTAQHYHSMIVNIILGFSAVTGIGIAVLWTEQGLVWRKNISFMFAYLMFYFIFVMYIVFLRELSYQISILIP